MKHVTILFLILLLAVSSTGLRAQEKKMMEKWIPIITEKDFNVKYEKLEEFRSLYGEKKSELIPMMYHELTKASFKLQKFDKTVEFGEKALTFSELNENDRLFIYNWLANAYFALKTDYNKALEYSEKVIEVAQKLKGNGNATQFDNEIIAPALRLQSRIIYNQNGSADSVFAAAKKALAALQVDKSKESDQLVRALAKVLNDQQKESENLEIMEELYQITPSPELAKSLALFYHMKIKDDEKAMEYFLASYQLEKNPEVAYDLGILYNKLEDIDTALNYLAEAFVLNDEKWSPKADEVLKHLYFNVKMKDIQDAEEKEKGFEELLTAAKTRLGIEETTETEFASEND